MPDFHAHHRHLLGRLSITSKRLKPGNLLKLINFAEALELQQISKQQARAKAHDKRTNRV